MPIFSTERALAAIRERRDESETLELERLTTLGRGLLDPNSPKERIARAKRIEAEILGRLNTDDLPKGRLTGLYDRLGELAAEQGDYQRAATISRTTERRHYYQSIVDAIEGKDTCNCPDTLQVDRRNGTESRESPIIHYDTIVTPDGGMVQLQKCIECGRMTTSNAN